jgi:guanylate kinase
VESNVNEGDLLLSDLRNRRKPKLYVITGPSGAGKDTIVKELRERFPEIHVVLKVDVQGAATIKERWPDAIVIFVSPGSMSQLLHQLHHRKTDNPEDLMRRYGEAESELPMAMEFDYFVFNENERYQQATDEIETIIRAERQRTRQSSPEI